VLSVLQYTDYDYPFSIFKLFSLWNHCTILESNMTLMFLVIYKANVCVFVFNPNGFDIWFWNCSNYVIFQDMKRILFYCVCLMWYITYMLLLIDHSTKIIHVCACSFTGTIVVHLLVQFWSHFGFLEPNRQTCGADDGGANFILILITPLVSSNSSLSETIARFWNQIWHWCSLSSIRLMFVRLSYIQIGPTIICTTCFPFQREKSLKIPKG
jgi:hypothetical protein